MLVILRLSLLPSLELWNCSEVKEQRTQKEGHFAHWSYIFTDSHWNVHPSCPRDFTARDMLSCFAATFGSQGTVSRCPGGLINLKPSSSHSSLGFCCLRGHCQEVAWTLPAFKTHRPLSVRLTITGYLCDPREILPPLSFCRCFLYLHIPFFFSL